MERVYARHLFLRDCEDALVEKKPESMENYAWNTLNKKAITYIKMVVSDEMLVDIKGVTTTHQVWEKLKDNLREYYSCESGAFHEKTC